MLEKTTTLIIEIHLGFDQYHTSRDTFHKWMKYFFKNSSDSPLHLESNKTLTRRTPAEQDASQLEEMRRYCVMAS